MTCHGTHQFAASCAIDLVAVEGGRSAAIRDRRTVLSTEPPDRFLRVRPAHPRAVRPRVVGVLAAATVVLQRDDGGYVALVHLRAGSIRVTRGERIAVGQEVGRCGNSGSSTQLHVRVQVIDAPDPVTARGPAVVFRDHRVRPRAGGVAVVLAQVVKGEEEVVEPL